MYMTLTTFIAFVVFLLGLYYYTKGAEREGFQSQCPNLLIQKDSKFYLYNSKQVKVPGVNPVEFDNLEDYTEFLDWQRSKGIRCPVLYLQQIFDAQGKPPSSDNNSSIGKPLFITSNILESMSNLFKGVMFEKSINDGT